MGHPVDNKTCCRIKQNINIIRVEPRTTYTNDKIVMVQCNGPDLLVKITSVPCAVFVLQLSALCRLQLRCDVMWCDVMWCDVMWCDVMWRPRRTVFVLGSAGRSEQPDRGAEHRSQAGTRVPALDTCCRLDVILGLIYRCNVSSHIRETSPM